MQSAAKYRQPDQNRYTRALDRTYKTPDLSRYRSIVADDIPRFDTTANPEIDTGISLPADLAHIRTPTRRLFVDYRANASAYAHLRDLPEDGQTLHGVISGKHALWDVVPAIIERTGQTIDQLYLVTLGFSKQNGADLCGLLDGGQVREATLVASYYFKSTSPGIYDAVVPELIRRGQRVLSMRNHAKMILAKLANGDAYVVESSANLRSSKNVETFVMTRDAGLYAFHREWIDRLFAVSTKRGTHGEAEDHSSYAKRSKRGTGTGVGEDNQRA